MPWWQVLNARQAATCYLLRIASRELEDSGLFTQAADALAIVKGIEGLIEWRAEKFGSARPSTR